MPFLTVKLSINVPEKESAFPATSVAAFRDLLEQIVVRWRTAVILQTAVAKVFAFLPRC